MGRLQDEATDPWGLLIAGVAGGVAAAASLGLAPALSIGAAVYGIKVGLGALTRRSAPAPPTRPPRPIGPVNPTVRHWLERADASVRSLRSMTGPTQTPTDAAVTQAAEGAGAVLDTMLRLADQSVLVDSALARAEAVGLDEEGARLAALARARPEDVSAQRSASAVADRIAVRDRMRAAKADLEGRLQSSALGLEGLVVRLAELQVASSTVGEVDPTSDDLAALTTDVEGLRRGLADAEQATRVVLRT